MTQPAVPRPAHRLDTPGRKVPVAILMVVVLLASMLAATVAAIGPSASATEQPGGTRVRSDQTFYAYVGAGETLDVEFTKVHIPAGDMNVGITVSGPGGVSEYCEFVHNAPLGTSCSFAGLSSPTAGVWEVRFDALDGGQTNSRFTWRIAVESGGSEIPGRVWSQEYRMTQTGPINSSTRVDFPLYYLSREGFLYEAMYYGYHGVDSIFASDAAGITHVGTCVSAYTSMTYAGPYSDTDRYSHPGNCGDPYKIFFEEPAADMPEQAVWPDGSTRWLNPELRLPELVSLTFARESAISRAGTFFVEVANFTGQMAVAIDVDGDGAFDGPADVQLPVAITDGISQVEWDGLDGHGQPVPLNAEVTASAAIDRAGEIHFVGVDVEIRSGIQVTALNGPDAGSRTLYWDDTGLRTAERDCVTPQLDGRSGVDSTGGVHGWPCSTGQNDGVYGSWGDARNIDNWTYQALEDRVEEVELPDLPLLDIAKESDATAATRVGDTVTYTVTVTNEGPGDYTTERPARVDDDLTAVLDDATYNDDVEASTGEVDVDGSRLQWTGPLAAGDSVTITYSVELTGEGDLNVDNAAFQVVCENDDPDCVPEPPAECVDGVDPATGLPCDSTDLPLPRLQVDKVADTTEVPEVGDTVTYTVTATNTGEGDFTAQYPAFVADDLSDVVDDATFHADTVASDRDGDLAVGDSHIAWSGQLPAGEAVTLTYEVTYTATGDGHLHNVAFGSETPEDPYDPPETPECVEGDPLCEVVSLPGPIVSMTKTVDPASGTTVSTGQELTYTLTFGNTGQAAGVIDHVDHLADVLDDAEIITEPAASDEALSLSLDGDQLAITGSLEPGQSETVTYTVRVLDPEERGNHHLGNFLTPTGEVPPEECAAGDPLCTSNDIDPPSPGLEVVKRAWTNAAGASPYLGDHLLSEEVPGAQEAARGQTLPRGESMTWTFTVLNTGDTPISGISVDDDVLGAASCPADTLAAGEAMTCTVGGELAATGARD